MIAFFSHCSTLIKFLLQKKIKLKLKFGSNPKNLLSWQSYCDALPARPSTAIFNVSLNYLNLYLIPKVKKKLKDFCDQNWLKDKQMRAIKSKKFDVL